jgi:hypothetical protein
MAAVRVIGWLLLVAALLVLARDLVAWHDTGVLAPVSLGQLWSDVGRASLDHFQATIQRLGPTWMCDGIIAAFLRWWAVPSFALPGLVLAWLGRRPTHSPS